MSTPLRMSSRGFAAGRSRPTEVKPIKLEKGWDSWDTCVAAFLARCEGKNLSKHTLYFYRREFQGWYKTLIDMEYPTLFEQLRPNQIEAAMHRMKKVEGLSDGSIVHRFVSMKVIFKFLEKRGYISANHVRDVEGWKAEKKIIESFTDKQVRDLLGAADRTAVTGFRDYVMMRVLLATGVRLSGLLGMELEDIRGNFIRIRLKGNKGMDLPLDPGTRDLIKRWVDWRVDQQVGHDFLWLSERGEQMLSRNFQKRVTEYGLKAGIKGVRVSPHTFRHTFARMFLMNGGESLVLQEILGHEDVSMTKRYVRLWGKDLVNAMTKYSPAANLNLD